MLEQAKFTYSPLGKAFEKVKLTKMINREDLIYKTRKYIYNFYQLEIIRSSFVKDTLMHTKINVIY